MVAQLASLRAEVGAFLGSEVLTHVGMVGGEGEHPWHHFGSPAVGVEELQLKCKVLRFGCKGSGASEHHVQDHIHPPPTPALPKFRINV